MHYVQPWCRKKHFYVTILGMYFLVIIIYISIGYNEGITRDPAFDILAWLSKVNPACPSFHFMRNIKRHSIAQTQFKDAGFVSLTLSYEIKSIAEQKCK